MTMLRFLRPAEAELIDAASYYESQSPGLGASFLAEAQSVALSIQSNPLLASKISDNVHRWLLKRFPYSVVYRVEAQGILVLAVAHTRRKFGYWEDR